MRRAGVAGEVRDGVDFSRAALRLLALLVIAAPSCHAFAPAPRAEVVIVVDTDLPVPRMVGQLRVDVFRVTADPADWHGLRWTATNEFTLESRRDWPASFGVTLEEGESSARFLVRLRAARSGLTRSYRGDRYLAPPAPGGDPRELFVVPSSSPGAPPRLLVDGADRTPPLEPAPSSTVDRLVLLDLAANERGQVAILLEGDCAGMESDLADRRTCAAGVVAEAATLAIAPGELPERGVATAEGTWPATAGPRIPISCDGPEVEARRRHETIVDGHGLHDEQVCIPGGAFLFGESAWAFGDPADQSTIAGLDEQRIVAVPRVFVDRHEYTVGRARRSSQAGRLLRNDGLLVGISPKAGCTYTTRPGVRDDYPLNCVSASQAATMCESDGRALTSTVVWLYALHNAADGPTTWPWGDATPSHEERCAGAVVERSDAFAPACGAGLPTVGDAATRMGPRADVSQRGVRDLVGSLAEMQSDAAWPFAARCWRVAGRVAPTCEIDGSARWWLGSSFLRPFDYVYIAPFLGAAAPVTVSVETGFRCMRFVDR